MPDTDEKLQSSYCVPKWFLSDNVKLHWEIDGAKSKVVCLSATDDDQVTDIRRLFRGREKGDVEVTATWFQSVRDSLVAPLVANQAESTLHFQPSILLQRPQEDTELCADSLIEGFAKDLRAHVVQLDTDALGVLGWHFFHDPAEEDDAGISESTTAHTGCLGAIDRSKFEEKDLPLSQDHQGLAYFYFGVQSKANASSESRARSKAAIAALFDAIRAYVQSAFCANMPAQDEQCPIIVYIRDTGRYSANKSMRLVARLREGLLHEYRKDRRFLLVVSWSEDTYMDSEDLIAAKLRFDAASTFSIPDQPKEHLTYFYTRHFQAERRQYTALNIRRLKQAVCSKLPPRMQDHPPWRPSPWDFRSQGGIVDAIAGRILTAKQLQSATRQIVGRCWNCETLQQDDILSVLPRIEDTDDEDEESDYEYCTSEESGHESEDSNQRVVREIKAEQESEIKSEPEKEPKSTTELTTQATLPELDASKCDDFEKQMLDHLVDRKALTVGYESVVIDEKYKEKVKALLSLFKAREKSTTHPLLDRVRSRGALFYGPPGTGKTQMCRAIAKESGLSMLAIDGANIQSKWTGETEKLIRAAFSLCVKAFPCILFIDEVDAIFGQRQSSQHSWERSMMTQFLKEMDGLSSDERSPFVIVATNRPTDLDEAFLRRLPLKMPFLVPNEAQRREILQLNLKDVDLDGDGALDKLCEATRGYSGSDIHSLCGQAALAWIIENTNQTDEATLPTEDKRLNLRYSHFQTAMETTKPTVSAQSMKDIDRFEKLYNPTSRKKEPERSDASQPVQRDVIQRNVPQHPLTSDKVSSGDETDQDDGDKYTYEPLPSPTTIRILCIEPGTRDDPVRCTLELVDLATDPKYEALSYVWGPEKPASEIICSNAVHAVRQNLLHALETFRLQDRCRYIWADALCINQDDIAERSLQVELMGQIFTKATRTLIWLGRESPGLIHTALGYLCQLIRLNSAKLAGPTTEEKWHVYKEMFESKFNTYHWEGQALAIPPDSVEPPDAKVVESLFDPALIALFRNSYFSRGWVIQEIALSSFDCYIFWGNGKIHLAIFAVAVVLLKSYESSRIIKDELAWAGLSAFYAMMDLQIRKGAYSLLQRIEMARNSCFTNPLDRVYGLLGLGDPEAEPEFQDVKIIPNYDIPVAECYRELAKQHLSTHDNMYRLLTAVQHDRHVRPDWPSWIPDWRVCKTRIGINQALYELGESWLDDIQPVGPIMHGDQECVTLRGFRITTLKRIFADKPPVLGQETIFGHEIISGHEVWALEKEYLRYLMSSLADLTSPTAVGLAACVGHSCVEKLVRDPFGQLEQPMTIEGDFYPHHLSATAFLCDWTAEECEAKVREEIADAEVREDLDKFSREKWSQISATNFEIKARQALTGRAFFETMGKWVVVGPDMAGGGDEVVVVHGCPSPFLLRPAADGMWYMLGECYVPSETVADIVKEKLDKEEKFEVFTIR